MSEIDYGALVDKERADLASAPVLGEADYGAMLDRERGDSTQRVAASLAQAAQTNPDAYAKLTGQAKQLDVPTAAVEAAPEESAQRLLTRQAERIARDNPALAARMADPAFAKMTHDDIETLLAMGGKMGPQQALTNEAFAQRVKDMRKQNPTMGWDEARTAALQGVVIDNTRGGVTAPSAPPSSIATLAEGVASAFVEHTKQAKYGAQRLFGGLVGSDAMVTAAKRATAGSKMRELTTIPQPEGLLGDVYSGVQSTVQTAPAMALAFASMPLSLGVMGLQQMLPEYNKYMDRGATIGEAVLGSGLEGAAEIAGELIPMGYMVKKFGRTGMVDFVAGLLGREIPSEIATTIAQTVTDTAIANPDKTWGDWRGEFWPSIRQTVVATLVQSAFLGGAGAVLRRSPEDISRRADERWSQYRELNKFFTTSKLAERDPGSFGALVQEMADEAGGPIGAVYVDAGILMQSGVDLTALSPEVKSDLADAVAHGGEVKIPLGEYATKIAPQGDVLLEHLKSSPEEFSKAEAAVYMQEQSEQLKADAEKILAEGSDQEAVRAETQVVKQSIMQQLRATGRWTDDVNTKYAEFVQSMYTVMGAREGMTAADMLARYPLAVNATGIAGENTLEAQGQSSPIVNIGLARPDGGTNTPEQVLAALQAIGVNVSEHAIHQSETESTVVATLDRALTPDEANALSAALGQEAIAQHADGAGELYGPKADAWKPFNPEFFLNMRGEAASTGGFSQLHGDAYKAQAEAGGYDTSVVWYNGNAHKSNVLDPNARPNKMVNAIFLTRDPAFASRFANMAAGGINSDAAGVDIGEGRPKATAGANVMPLWARTRVGNYFDFENEEHLKKFHSWVLNGGYIDDKWSGSPQTQADNLTEDVRSGNWEVIEEDPRVAHFLNTQGWDGFYIVENDEKNLAVFDSTSIKSAIGNNGNFSPDNPSVLEQAASLRRGTETLRKYGLDPNGRYTVRQVAAALQTRQREKYGKIKATDRSSEASSKIAKWMADEVEFEMQHPAKSGAGWYSSKFQRALDTMAEIHPELKTNQGSRDLFTALLALTSNGHKVLDNFRMAEELYRNYRDTGDLTGERSHIRDAQHRAGLETLVKLIAENGIDGLRDTLLAETTVGEMNKIARANGQNTSGDYQAATTVPVAAVYFGPKLGAYFANLMGADGYLTMDRWWSRTFNRYRGDLIPAPTDEGLARFRELIGQPKLSKAATIAATVPYRNSYFERGFKNGTEIERAANTIYKAAFEELNDVPFNATDRTFMYETIRKARANLKRRGVEMSLVDIQAVLWYYEKRLYGELGSKQSADTSYEEAAELVVNESRGDLFGPRSTAGSKPAAVRGAGKSLPGSTLNQDAIEFPHGVLAPEYGTPREGAISVLAVHYSHEQRTALDAGAYGRGKKDAGAQSILAHADKRLHRRVHFYVPEGKGVEPERGVGQHAHLVTLHNLYDGGADPQKLSWNAKDPQAFEAAVLDAGYDGYYARGAFGTQGAAVLLNPRAGVPVRPVADAALEVGPYAAPVTPISDERALAIQLASDKRLPAGQLTGPEWLTVIEQKAPDINSRLPEEAKVQLASQVAPIYRNEIARTFYQAASLTPEQRAFLADTKAVDANGEPLQVYHGTKSKAGARLDPNHPGRGGNAVGTMFTADRAYAENYGREERGGRVVEAFLRVVNPLDARDEAAFAGYKANRLEGESLVAYAKRTGHDGAITSLDEYVVFSPEQIVEIAAPGVMGQKAHGQITFGSDIQGGATITLLETANLSTFLHETGHFFLEVLADMAAQPQASAGVKADMQKALDWFGVKDLATWRAMSLDEKRPYHEKWARGAEAYVGEGKAPSIELQGVFGAFRSWILHVYKSLRELNVTLTDEVRGVFDRMLATDEQIRQAEVLRGFTPLFSTAAEMGKTAEEFAEYQALGVEASDQATLEMQARSMRDLKWTQNAHAFWSASIRADADAKRKAVREEVEAEVQTAPVFAAMRWMRTGILPDGTKTVGAQLDRAALKEIYGEGPAALWRYLPNNLTSKEGLHPDTIAEMFGYSSGDLLVRTILDAGKMSVAIEGLTDQRMLERYGDLADERAIAEAADKAIHNEARSRFVATELNALAKATGKPKILTRAAKAFAEAIVARKRVGEVSPHQYQVNETRAARAAMKNLAAGKTAEAAAEKRNQLVNMYAARAAQDARAYVEKSLRYLKKAGEAESIDPEYREQVQQLLERFDLYPVTQREQAKRVGLVEWMEQQRALGFEPSIDKALEAEARRTPYKNLTVEEFRGLVDAVRNIEHLGRLKRKLFLAKDKREFDAIVTAANDSIRAHAQKTVPERRASDRGPLVKLGKVWRGYLAEHRKLSSRMREFDGLQDGGLMWNLFSRTMNEQGAFEAAEREKAGNKLAEVLAPLLAKGPRALRKKTAVPGTNKSFTYEERIGIALNMGNAVNKERVLTGEGLTPAQLQSVLDPLTQEDWAVVVKVWKFLDSFRADIAAKQKRVTGVEPEWVEAEPFQTKFGVVEGGYYPIKYDPERGDRAGADDAASIQRQMERGLFVRAQTRRGHLEERVKSTGRTMRYDLDVIGMHVNQVIHDLAWHEWLIDSNRLLPRLEGAIREHYGSEAYTNLKNTLRDIAVGEMGAMDMVDGIFRHLRVGATIAGLGWRVTTSLLQPFGLTQSMVRIGPKWVAKGLANWLGSSARMEGSIAAVRAKSEFMRTRGKTQQREINEILNKVSKGGISGLETSYFWMIQAMQTVADMPTWLGAYEKAYAQASMTEELAISLADQAVIDSQGTGQIGDLSSVQRGSEFKKLWTNFYSFFNVTYNLAVESGKAAHAREPLTVAKAAVDYCLLLIVPAALSFALKSALKFDGDDDPEKLMKGLLAEEINYMLGMLVGLREVGAVFSGAQGYSGPAGARFFSDLGKFGKQAWQGDVDEAALKAAANTLGGLFHLPSGQVTATVDGIHALSTGATQNPGALLVGSKAN